MTHHKRADQTALSAAREYARWHLGDPEWADILLSVYRDPAGAMRMLADDQGDKYNRRALAILREFVPTEGDQL